MRLCVLILVVFLTNHSFAQRVQQRRWFSSQSKFQKSGDAASKVNYDMELGDKVNLYSLDDDQAIKQVICDSISPLELTIHVRTSVDISIGDTITSAAGRWCSVQVTATVTSIKAVTGGIFITADNVDFLTLFKNIDLTMETAVEKPTSPRENARDTSKADEGNSWNSWGVNLWNTFQGSVYDIVGLAFSGNMELPYIIPFGSFYNYQLKKELTNTVYCKDCAMDIYPQIKFKLSVTKYIVTACNVYVGIGASIGGTIGIKYGFSYETGFRQSFPKEFPLPPLKVANMEVPMKYVMTFYVDLGGELKVGGDLYNFELKVSLANVGINVLTASPAYELPTIETLDLSLANTAAVKAEAGVACAVHIGEMMKITVTPTLYAKQVLNKLSKGFSIDTEVWFQFGDYKTNKPFVFNIYNKPLDAKAEILDADTASTTTAACTSACKHGICVHGECVCRSGWAGDSCDESLNADDKKCEFCYVPADETFQFCKHLRGAALCVHPDLVKEYDTMAFERSKSYLKGGFTCQQRMLALQCEILMPRCSQSHGNHSLPICLDSCVEAHTSCEFNHADAVAECTEEAIEYYSLATHGETCRTLAATPPGQCVESTSALLTNCPHISNTNVFLFTNAFGTVEEADEFVGKSLPNDESEGCLHAAKTALCHTVLPECNANEDETKVLGLCTHTCTESLNACERFNSTEVHAFCHSHWEGHYASDSHCSVTHSVSTPSSSDDNNGNKKSNSRSSNAWIIPTIICSAIGVAVLGAIIAVVLLRLKRTTDGSQREMEERLNQVSVDE